MKNISRTSATPSVRAKAPRSIRAWFDAEKTLIMSSLGQNPNNEAFFGMRGNVSNPVKDVRPDRSLAGGVDPGIAPFLFNILNKHPNYVSLSSCSGRVSLFHRSWHPECAATGTEEILGLDETIAKDSGLEGQAARKRGALGLGTLWSSHDPIVNIPSVAKEIQHHIALGHAQQPLVDLPHPADVQTTIQLKFEPMILHVLCAPLEKFPWKTSKVKKDIEVRNVLQPALDLLSVASESGQRRSGLISVKLTSTKGGSTAAGLKIVVSVSSHLGFDVPLCWTCRDGQYRSTASPQQIEHFLEYANFLFAENLTRTRRFSDLFHSRLK